MKYTNKTIAGHLATFSTKFQNRLLEKDWPNQSSQLQLQLVRRYTAAFAVNFTDWMGKTLPFVRHERARYALTDNLRCECAEEHIQLLYQFADALGAMPRTEDLQAVSEGLEKIRTIFVNPVTAGLSGLTLLTVLENTSPIFIPVLHHVAVVHNSVERRYTSVHGEADAEHSEAFLKALESELMMGYSEEQRDASVGFAFSLADDLLQILFGGSPS